MPQAVQWGPCDVSAQPVGVLCREIVPTWNLPAGELAPFGSYTASQVGPDGGVTLATARLVDDGAGDFVRYTLIADADGRVRQAIFESTTKQCASIVESVQDGVAVYHVYEGNSDFGGGAFGGNIDDPIPRIALKFSDHVAHEFAAGLPGIVDDATMQLYDFLHPSKPPSRISDPLDQASSPSFLAFSGQALFWQAQTASLQKEKVWTPSGGARDLIAFGSDLSQGAADLGTDGRDIVWLQGAGRSGPAGPFPTVSIMAAPFTSDASMLQARRLRSEDGANMGVEPFKVGCGYAALALNDGIRVTRLSDGASWHLGRGDGSWQWVNPVALTCTELFAKVEVHADGGFGVTKFARVRLDSLGHSTPAD